MLLNVNVEEEKPIAWCNMPLVSTDGYGVATHVVKAPSHQTSSHYVLENVAKTGSNGVRTE